MNNELSIFNLCLKLAPYLLGMNRQIQAPPTRTASPILTEKDLALLNLRQKLGSVTVVLGSRDTGKTELCWRLMEFLDRPAYAVSPQQKPPSWITWIKEPNDIFTMVPPDSTLLMDDLPSLMSNRDYSEPFTRAVEKAIPMVRHEPNPPDYPIGQIHLIFSSQSAAQADRYILDCDAAFLKPLGLLMADVERPAITRIYKTLVDPEFAGKDDYFIQRHAYMMSRTFRGLIEVKKTT